MPSLLLYRLLFMAELFVAEFLFIFRRRKRSLFALRFTACVILGGLITLVLPLRYNALYTAVTFLFFFATTLPMLKFCCDEPWLNIFFCGIAAYSTQHFAYGVANFFMTLIEWGRSPIFDMYFEGAVNPSSFNLNSLFMALVYFLLYYSSYALCYFIFGKKLQQQEIFRIKSTSIMFLVAVALLVDIALGAITIYFSDGNNIIMTLLNIVYETLCCLFLLHIQFGLVKTGALENELDFTERLLHEKARQYELSKENIDLINYKCHDLKHWIRTVGENKGLSDDTVREIEDAITIYDAKVSTDNEVLDTILTEKSLKCAQEGISLTCVADGHALDFMKQSDIYSIFGNSIENAIEAVQSLPKDKREIGVVVRKVGNMVSMNVHNYFEGSMRFGNDGLPITTKEDVGFHGFGIRSIRLIAEKYQGTLSVSVKSNTFSLNILIPSI